MKTISTSEIQSIVLEIMFEFHKICEEHNLYYVLDSGTLLGAIRHNGFIPWDDDVDIAMPRKDYEKFIQIADKELNPMYKAQNKDNEKYYYQHFIKLRRTDRFLKEDYMSHFDIEHGPWIDIFPYDLELKDPKLEKNRVNDINIWYKLWGFITPVPNRVSNESKFKTFSKNAVISVLKYLQKHNSIFLNILERYYRKTATKINGTYYKDRGYEFSDKMYMTYTFIVDADWKHRGRRLSAESFQSRELIKFEKYEFYIPSNYDEILSNKYGDYMSLPPVEQRVSNHNLVIVD